MKREIKLTETIEVIIQHYGAPGSPATNAVMRKIKVNGSLVYTDWIQKPISPATNTPIDVFYKWLAGNKQAKCACNAGSNRGNSFNLFRIMRLKALNFKQKFFNISLKQVFACHKTTSVKQIVSLGGECNINDTSKTSVDACQLQFLELINNKLKLVWANAKYLRLTKQVNTNIASIINN
jgi:hypothetical protein